MLAMRRGQASTHLPKLRRVQARQRNECGRSDVNMAAEQISRVKIDPALFGVGDQF